MVNLLRYRDRALYDGHSEEAVCSGREAYHRRYLPVFQRLAANTDYKLRFFGAVAARLVGPEGAQWDESRSSNTRATPASSTLWIRTPTAARRTITG